jgi:hypothetical protein
MNAGFKGGARRRHHLIGAFTVEYAYGNQGACGQRPEPAAYLLDFLLVQVTSTLANQYSVLVIHVFSPFVMGPLSGPKLVKRNLHGGNGY